MWWRSLGWLGVLLVLVARRAAKCRCWRRREVSAVVASVVIPANDGVVEVITT